ncbi:MAG: glycine--tRNA ligase [Patescibacteria group bacterium]
MKNSDNLMDKIVSLCKRRGFIYPGSEIYGGLANSWDYGPLGVELKNNIKNLWWKIFTYKRDDMYGIDSALIMNRKVWQASGHEVNFSDPLSDCKKCKNRFRPDKLENPKICPVCGGELTEPRQFNTMMKTYLGPVENDTGLTYLRPETAQGMFVNFKNIIDSFHPRIPFGIAQIGKAFRNEITPGNFIFRTREFEQMEIEYFIREDEWKKWFDHWLSQMKNWMKLIGIKAKNLNFHEIPDGERAHYSKRTIDIEYKFPFGLDELYGLAYRTNFDLKNHSEQSGVELNYSDQITGDKFLPHVIEPTFGVDRTLLAVLLEAYSEEEGRVVLKLAYNLSPHKAAVFPLLANKPDLSNMAKNVYDDLRKDFKVVWDDRGNIGKRYYSQDEIGTPFCITVDFDSLENNDVTVRNRDTMAQERIKISELKNYLTQKLTD